MFLQSNLIFFNIQTLHYLVIEINVLPELAQQTIIAHTLSPVPYKGRETIRA
jgi:hypothetical protein